MKYILLITLIGLSCSLIKAQDSTAVIVPKKQQNIKDKIYYGGNIGLSFGSYTAVSITPLAAYKFTPKFSAGIKLAYEYISDNRYDQNYNSSNYGASIFSRYRVLQPLYLHAEYAAMNYELYNILGQSEREWVPFLLLGAGYSQKVSKNSWLNVQILFDVLQDDNSPYKSGEPFYSIGFGVGF